MMNRFRFVFCLCWLFFLFDGQSAVMAFSKPSKNYSDDYKRFETLLEQIEQIRKTEQEKAMEYAKEALELGESKSDQKMIARAQRAMASIKFDAQNFMKAMEYAQICLPFFEKTNDVENLAILYNLLSSSCFHIGNAEMSDMYSDKCLEIAEKNQILDILNIQYYNRGAIAFYRSDYSQSMEFALKALNIAKKNNQPVFIAYCYDLLGSLAEKMAEYRKAIQYFNLSLKIYLANGNKLFIGQTYGNLASAYLKVNQPDSSRLNFYRALNYYREAESASGLASTYSGLANFYYRENSLDSAQIMIGRSLKAALLSETIKDLFESYDVAGDIFLAQGNRQKAVEYYRKGLTLAYQNGNKDWESSVKRKLSSYFASTGRYDSAYLYLSKSFAINDSLFRFDEVQKRAYTFAEHNVKEQHEKEMKAEQMKLYLWYVIMGLCVAVMVILIIFIRSMSVRQKKIKSINEELNQYKAELEHTLQNKTRELVLSEQQILNLSNNLPNGAIFRFLFENERQGKMLYVSSGWEELTGMSLEASKDSMLFFQSRIHPDDSRELLKALAHAIQNHTILDITYRFYKNNTDLRWFHVRAMAIAGDNGMTYVDGYQVDETEQKHFEQELITARDKAEESDRLKSAFLANMSHEIRTPMNAIVGFSTLLTNPKLTHQRKDSYLELIQTNCQQLLRLIDDIVDISKIEANQLNLRMETVPLSEVIKAVSDYFDPVINSGGHPHVELWIDENLLHSTLNVHTDVFRLKQIFVNLIENALKFTEKGFVRCGYLDDQPEVVHFYIMDTGMGISHENIENIFQSFRKLDHYSGGTGLGLSIVKRILLQMGGSIWVESEPSVGSTFHFTIPLKP